MKQTIKWHKERLENLKFCAVAKRKHAEVAAYGAAKTEIEVAFLAAQIGQAEKLGKDGFDSEKFMAKLNNVDKLEEFWANRPQS